VCPLQWNVTVGKPPLGFPWSETVVVPWLPTEPLLGLALVPEETVTETDQDTAAWPLLWSVYVGKLLELPLPTHQASSGELQPYVGHAAA
jgi:hypothetical protein